MGVMVPVGICVGLSPHGSEFRNFQICRLRLVPVRMYVCRTVRCQLEARMVCVGCGVKEPLGEPFVPINALPVSLPDGGRDLGRLRNPRMAEPDE